jgi:hypothetical protein
MNASSNSPELRWANYFMRGPAHFDEFWRDYLKGSKRRLLFIIGHGIDPRMCHGIQAILKNNKGIKCDCMLVEFDEGPDSPTKKHVQLAEENKDTLRRLLKSRGSLLDKTMRMWTDDRRRIGSIQAADIVSDITDISRYTDVIIDVSAMPRGVYFPLIGKTLYLLENAKTSTPGTSIPNLHVIVSEDANQDRRMRSVGIDDTADYVHGFTSPDLEAEATAEIRRVWIPILGEEQAAKLERIYTLVHPDEICPVLPSPSRNPRRGDDLLIEYRELILDQWRVDPKNIVFASEQNPFETYRQIHRTVRLYNQALGPLGGCKAIISALSSKLLSIGAMLAVYELKQTEMSVGLAHVEAQGYDIVEIGQDTSADLDKEELFTLWLSGECYE